jgi:hypothetical protein
MVEKLDSTPESYTSQLAAIDEATLTPLVRSTLNSQTVEVLDWNREQLHGGVGVGTAIYRFSGEGHDQGLQAPWSLILKTLCPQADNTDVSAWSYYKREIDAYRSGWLDDLPGGLAAPRCFGVSEYPDGVCWIWLEDVEEEIGTHWPLEQYGVVARHTGQFNGAYLVEGAMPSWPWLSEGWLRGYVALSAPTIPRIRSSLDHPLVRRGWPGDASDRLFRLWEERDLFFDTLDRLPQTRCHLDLFRRNLFARKTAEGDDETVVIDWAFAGRSAIGMDLVALVLASIAFNEVDLAQAQTLEEIAFEGYLEGLEDAGWRGDPRQARLGYTAGSLRIRLGELNRAIDMILNESYHAIAEQAFGLSMEEIEDRFGQVGILIDGLIDEARGLMDVLG